jgi:hypothetical protein
MKFYLGAGEPIWLSRTDVPLFLSHSRLKPRKFMPYPVARWALDSGGFKELELHGRWRSSPEEYATYVESYDTRIGRLDWAAPQDWMVEPWIVERTGLTVHEHQLRTVENYLELRRIAPHLPFIPVLQGWTLEDYLTCIDLYEKAGVALASEEVVGLGSVCRRQSTYEVFRIVSAVASFGISLHGFGVKTRGLRLYGHLLTSADSQAWSVDARYGERMEDCSHRGKCTSCLDYALKWRQNVLQKMEQEK